MRAMINRCTPCIDDIGVEDSNDPGVQKRVIGVIIIVGQCHDITVSCGRVDGVLFPTNIICSVVDAKNLVKVYAVLFE